MSADNDKQDRGTFHKASSAILRGSSEGLAGYFAGMYISKGIDKVTQSKSAGTAVMYGIAALGLIHGAVTGWRDIEENDKLLSENAILKKENKNWTERIEVMQEKAQQAGVKI